MKTNVIVVFLILAGTFHAGAAVLGEDGRKPITEISYPMTSVARVEKPDGQHCSGSLIAPQVILTAKHCLEGFADQVEGFSIQFHGSTQIWGAASFKTASNVDLGLLYLKSPIRDRQPIPLGRSVSEGEIANFGYPGDLSQGLRLQGQADCSIRQVSSHYLKTDCDVMRGQSGGPLLASTPGGQWKIVAINSFVVCGDLSHSYAPAYGPLCFSGATSVESVRDLF
jgi:hypothetical protein